MGHDHGPQARRRPNPRADAPLASLFVALPGRAHGQGGGLAAKRAAARLRTRQTCWPADVSSWPAPHRARKAFGWRRPVRIRSSLPLQKRKARRHGGGQCVRRVNTHTPVSPPASLGASRSAPEPRCASPVGGRTAASTPFRASCYSRGPQRPAYDVCGGRLDNGRFGHTWPAHIPPSCPLLMRFSSIHSPPYFATLNMTLAQQQSR